MTLNYVSVGKKIKAIRKKRGLSQMKLAENAELSPTYISYIECGIKSMSLDAFVRIANALNITADELLSDSLENTIKVSNHEFTTLLTDCTYYEKRILRDIVAATKKSIRENSCYLRSGR
jgi:transcriptional regulator with XRE-family HTH domain